MNEHVPSDAESAAMQRLKTIAGRLTDEDFQRDKPPTQLWDAIDAELNRPTTDVVTMRRTHRRAWLSVAAVVAAALALTGGLLLWNGDEEDVVASASLTNKGLSPLGSASSGKAEILRRGTSYLLHLDIVHVPQESSSYTEVWLIDSQVKGMISLGPFHGNGDYVIPSGVDPADYPIIDVSLEPSDGVPTHSGVSIVRGVAAT